MNRGSFPHDVVRMPGAALVARARALLPSGSLRHAVVALVGAATVAQALAALSAPILTRLYAPTEIGTYSVASSILSVLIVVACLRYEWAIPLPGSDTAAANVVALCVLVSVVVSLVAGVLLGLLWPALMALFGTSMPRWWVVLIVLAQVGGGIGLALTSWMIRTKTFNEIARNRLIQSGTLVGVQVALGFLRWSTLGLLLGSVASPYAGSLRLARRAWRSNASAFRSVTWAGIRFAASRYRRFPIFSSGSAVLNSLGESAPLLLMVALYGTAVGGQFALAFRVGILPVSLVAAAVSQVFVGETARLARDDPPELRAMFGRTTRILAVGSIVPFVLLAVLAPIFAPLVFGDAWEQAGLFVALLAPMFYVQLITSPTGGTLDVLERQDLHLLREVLRLVFVGGAAVVAAELHLAPEPAVLVFSIAGSLTYVVYGLASWTAIVQAPRRPLRH